MQDEKKANAFEEKKKAKQLSQAMRVIGKLSPLHAQLVGNIKDKKASLLPDFVMSPAQQSEHEINKARHCLTV